jgi:hypothetical protein
MNRICVILAPLICFASFLAGCVYTGDAKTDSGDARSGDVNITNHNTVVRSGVLKVRNPYAIPVIVMIDGRNAGWLNAGAWGPYSVVQGQHEVTMLTAQGQVLGSQTLETSGN